MTSSEPIYHLTFADEWDLARAKGEYRPDSLVAEGFVHLSFRHQVAATAQRLFPEPPDGELVVLEVDPTGLSAPVVLEDLYQHGSLFPHVYGPIPTTAVRAVHPLSQDQQGRFSFDPR